MLRIGNYYGMYGFDGYREKNLTQHSFLSSD